MGIRYIKGGKAIGESAGRDRWRGGGRGRRTGGGLHWGGALVSRAWFGVQDIVKGTAIPEVEAPGLTTSGGDRDFTPGLEV